MICLGLLEKEDKVKDRVFLNIETEGYNTLMSIEDKVQNYPNFDSEENPKIEDDFRNYCCIRNLMMLQELMKIFRWNRLASLSLLKNKKESWERTKTKVVDAEWGGISLIVSLKGSCNELVKQGSQVQIGLGGRENH
jgi:hypothetical protein